MSCVSPWPRHPHTPPTYSNRGLPLISPPHPFLNRQSRWGTTDDFTTGFLHFSLFSTAPLDLANFRPVHSLMLSSPLFTLSALSSSPFRAYHYKGLCHGWLRRSRPRSRQPLVYPPFVSGIAVFTKLSSILLSSVP